MLTEDDTVVIAVEFSGARAISQVYTSSHLGLWMSDGHAQWPTSYANKHVYEAVADRDAVIASTGRTYWHDTADNLVWIKVQGGIQMVWNDADFNDTDDERLYREFGLRIY
jgi:hypothetical protein